MGNSLKTQSSIFQVLDTISSDYILSMDYHALAHMNDQEYCNKFTILTQDILDK